MIISIVKYSVAFVSIMIQERIQIFLNLSNEYVKGLAGYRERFGKIITECTQGCAQVLMMGLHQIGSLQKCACGLIRSGFV